MPGRCVSYLSIAGPPRAREELLADLRQAGFDVDPVPTGPEDGPRTTLRIATSREPPVDAVCTLSDVFHYPRLAFELAYCFEHAAGGGFIRFADGLPSLHERAEGADETFALLERRCPALAESLRA